LNYDHNNSGPTNVGSYPLGQSTYGLLDVSGNVWEWVADFYLASYYETMPDRNPSGPSGGAGHPIRGGSWATVSDLYMDLLTTTFRLWNKPKISSNVLGFRCAMDG
jgi:formylglycine-generating enzyme required for sulfatase activity